jgi:hypothetical protein
LKPREENQKCEESERQEEAEASLRARRRHDHILRER